MIRSSSHAFDVTDWNEENMIFVKGSNYEPVY